MKNIHVLPTEKPSRLYNNNGQLHLDSVLTTSNGHTINQNIYITSDEQLKDGDWYIYIIDGLLRQYHEAFNPSAASASYNKKIILTTDSDLIADGVQSADEFLEWFVMNASCEEISTKGYYKTFEDGVTFDRIEYKIIIPKEESKQVPTAEEVIDKMVKFASVNDTINCTVYSLSKVMIDFAKLHVEAALKAADDRPLSGVDDESILTAYPLENIK
jgi:hypothetical protein